MIVTEALTRVILVAAPHARRVNQVCAAMAAGVPKTIAVEEVVDSLAVVLDKHPEYRTAKVLERICEAEASFESVAVSPSGVVYAFGRSGDLWVPTDHKGYTIDFEIDAVEKGADKLEGQYRIKITMKSTPFELIKIAESISDR